MEHRMLMFPAAGLAKALRVYCQGLRGAGSSWSAAVAAAAMKVLWQLRTTLCRGIHASTTGLTLAHPQHEVLLLALSHCLNTVVGVEVTQNERAAYCRCL